MRSSSRSRPDWTLRIFSNVVIGGVLTLAAILVGIPIFWTIGTAFKSAGEYFTDPPTWFPAHPTFEHFTGIPNLGAGWQALLNSFGVASITTAIAMIVGSAAAYGLARLKRRGDTWAVWFLSNRMLPPIATVIPIFLLIRTVHWIDTWQGLIVPYLAAATPFVVWMMRGYFSEVPTALEDSALTDGCSRWSALLWVVVPLALPGLLSIAVFTFLFTWNEFIVAVFITQTAASQTAPIQVSNYAGGAGGSLISWGEIAAFSLVAAAPLIIFGLLLQRYFIRGITLGAVKG